ncbi:MAG: carbon starvation CstA family protein [Anaerolineales bacterium]
MGIAVLLFTLLVLGFSYKFYVSRQVNKNIDPNWHASTPARRYMDGVNFFPTNPGVLTLFQFKSISLDVIISPIIALQFGWLPAILWLLVGAIFFGWVQDYMATIISVRSRGDSLSQLIGTHFTPRSRILILVFLLCYFLIIISQFGLLLATLLGRDDLPLAIIFLIIASFFAGYLLYRTKINPVLTTTLSVFLVILGLWLGSTGLIREKIRTFNQWIAELNLLNTSNTIQENFSWQTLVWLLIIFSVCYLAALLPTWRFAVPFNYISAWLVILAFCLGVIGLILGTLKGVIHPNFEIPPLISTNSPGIGPLWPVLFVTLSSGAVSGWHSLVSTYSTSHQLEKEPLTKPVITKAMYGEIILVTIVIILAATFGVSSGAFDATQNFSLTAGPATAFAAGFSKTWNVLGISEVVGGSISAYLLTIMSISILHLVIRYAGIVQSEVLSPHLHWFNKRGISILVILILAFLLIIFGIRQWIWVLFAGANQLIASLVLILAAVWLIKQGKNYRWVLWPGVFLYMTGIAAVSFSAFYQILFKQMINSSMLQYDRIIGSSIALVTAVILVGSATIVFFTGLRELTRYRSNLG